ncbi:MAG: transposase [Bacteroidetes bacterium]|nr:transposase [Bacteroidota bacterium]
MNYYAQIAVDDSFHVITGAVADYADKRDSECLPFVLKHTKQNLAQEQIKVEQIVADAAYSRGEALEYCEQNNIEPFIPNFGQYKSEREGFIYNKEKDQYECQRGNKAVLPLKRTGPNSSGYMMKVYRSSETVCKNCPLRKSCIGEKTKFKKIDNSIFKPHYDKMHEKLQTMHAKRILKKRSSTVEPVLGTMINFLNLKRTNARGIKQAMKHVLMSALVYNLKKYVNFVTRKRISVPVAIDFRNNFNKAAAFFNFLMLPHSLATNSFIKN